MLDVIELILNNGNFFAMIACVFMGWFVYDLNKTNRNMIMDITNEHKSETDKLSDAIVNNTLVIQKLLDKLDEEVKQ